MCKNRGPHDVTNFEKWRVFWAEIKILCSSYLDSPVVDNPVVELVGSTAVRAEAPAGARAVPAVVAGGIDSRRERFVGLSQYSGLLVV